MNLNEECEYQRSIAKWIDDNLSISYEHEDENESLALSCLDVAVENHAAIIILIQSQLYGSALSLLRVQLEALVRGTWLLHVATPEQCVKYMKSDVPKFYKLIEEVEAAIDKKDSLLSLIKESHWGIFNDFTHTGIEAIIRRKGPETTGHLNYRTEEIVKVLRHSGLYTVLAATELASLSKNQMLINKTLEFANQYGK